MPEKKESGRRRSTIFFLENALSPNSCRKSSRIADYPNPSLSSYSPAYICFVRKTVTIIHVALWLFLIVNSIWMGWDTYGVKFGFHYLLIKTLSLTLLHALIFYGHYVWMAPNFLYRKRWIRYVLMILLTVAIGNAWSWGMYSVLASVYDHQLTTFNLNYFLYFAIDALTYLLLSALAWFTWHGIKENKRLALLEKEKVRAELQALTGKVNPHFLFNTLNNIYVLVRSGNEKAEAAVLELAGLMRYMLERSDEEKVLLADEVKMMNDYIALQKLRLEPGFNLCFSFPPIEKDKVRVPPLLFLPLLENLFKHSDLSADGRINLKMTVKEGWVYWESTNTVDDTQEANGAGLRNLKERLALLYGEDFILTVNREGHLFETEMGIQL